MRPVAVFLTLLPKLLVEFLKGSNRGNRDEEVAAAVANLVFYVALLIAGCRIAEVGLETVVQHEAVECVSQRPFAIFQNLRHSCGHVVEAKARRDAANVLKDSLHSFQQALLVL